MGVKASTLKLGPARETNVVAIQKDTSPHCAQH